MLTLDVPEQEVEATERGSVTTEKWLLPVAILVVGMFMGILDVTIVNVAVPAIQREFGGSLEDVLWIATAYTLTLGVVVPLSSWLGDRLGVSALFAVTLFGFALGSALCGIAWDLESLIVFRILQAIPGGILPVVVLVILYKIVPKHRIGLAMGLYGLGAVFAPAVGPVLGGYLVEYTSWRLVFFLNLPVGLVAAIAAYFLVPRIPRVAVPRFDHLGFITVAIGLAAILLAASKGESWGWTGYRILILLVGGVLSLALFVVIELEVDHPLLDIKLFTIKPFAISALYVGLMFCNLLVAAFYVPVFLQQVQGLAALDAGILILPQALVMCVTIPLCGQLYSRFGPYWMASIGVVLLAWGNYMMADLNPEMPHSEIVLWTCVRAAGTGMAIIPIMTSGMAAIPPSQTNQASALYNVLQQVGAALGLAALATLATAQQAQKLADRTALITTDGALSQELRPLADGRAQLTQDTFATVYQLALRLQYQVLSSSYADIFLVCALVTLATVVLVPFLYNERAAAAQAVSRADDVEPAEPTEPAPAPMATRAAPSHERPDPSWPVPEPAVR